MSQQEFSLLVRIKESPELRQLQQMQEQGVSLGRGLGVSGRSESLEKLTRATEKHSPIFEKMRGSLSEIGLSTFKLVGIGTGIGALVAFATQASPLLVNTFKLLTTGFMLMIRPIADFVALLFRPIVLLFLSAVALPFFRTVFPWFRDTGKALGEDLKNVLLLISTPLTQTIPEALSKVNWRGIFEFLKSALAINITGTIQDLIPQWKSIEEFFTLTGAQAKALKIIWQSVVGFFAFVGSQATSILPNLWQGIVAFFGQAWADSITFLSLWWGQIVGWFETVFGDVVGALTQAWQTIVGGFVGFARIIQEIIDFIKSLLGGFLGFAAGGRGGQAPQSRQFGGTITEPEVGFGLITGRSFIQGEAGVETVSRGFGGGRNITVNVGDINIINPSSAFEADQQLRGRFRRTMQTEMINLDLVTP